MSDVTLIPLHGANGSIREYAVVDAEDAERLNQRRWSLLCNRYATRNAMVGGKRATIQMHREVLGLSHDDPREVDHLNGDGLDNRKVNLRAVTHAENLGNQRPQAGRASRFRGVVRVGKKWAAKVKTNGINRQLGVFENEAEAGSVVMAWWRTHLPHLADGVPPRISREGLPMMVPPSKNAHAVRSTNPAHIISGSDEFGPYVGIPVYGRNDDVIGHALVDPGDGERLSAYRWFAHIAKTPTLHVYPMRSVRDGRKWLQIPMYADVLNIRMGGVVSQVRRVNGNSLDNRQKNLRPVIRSERRRKKLAS